MRTIASAMVALFLLGSAAFAEKTSISALQGSSGLIIEGAVTQVFGNRFVLQDGTGSVLVDTGPRWFAQRTFEVGERLTVQGQMDEQAFEARRVTRSDGSMEVIRADRGPPPWAHGPYELKKPKKE